MLFEEPCNCCGAWVNEDFFNAHDGLCEDCEATPPHVPTDMEKMA